GAVTGEAGALPYGAGVAERASAAQGQPQGELAQTGPTVPGSVAVLLIVAALAVAGLARAGRAPQRGCR
ncbi:MAG: hypothetical protein M3P95_03500, partial [Actinomycetota bacterium]|nr:hypothetical protein [Actinomycetota bacterium]